MKAMKKIIKLFLSIMMIIISSNMTVLTVKGEQTAGNAYAVLTEEGELVFFTSETEYTDNSVINITDTNGKSYTGTVFTGIEDTSDKTIPWYSNRSKIKKAYVLAGNTIAPVTTADWFYQCTNLKEFRSEGFDTSNVTNMSSMFDSCRSLTSLDLSSFDTRNVTNMSDMFYNCNSLTEVKLGPQFTKWINNAYLPAGNWGNGEIAKSETELYSQYPGNATQWAGTWSKITQYVETISLDKTSMSLRKGQTEILYVTVLPENAQVKTLEWTSSDENVATVDQNGTVTAISNGRTVITVKATDGSGTSSTCIVKVSGEATDGTAYAILTTDGDLIFFRSNNSYTNSSNTTVTDINGNEYSGTVYANVEVTNSSGDVPWYNNRSRIKRVYVAENTVIKPVSMANFFKDCSNLVMFNGSGFDTTNVQYMNSIFYNCSSLTNLDLSNFDTRNVTDMSWMFDGCSSLTGLNLNSFNTSKVVYMGFMFDGCSSLTSLDLSNFNTRNVLVMSYMFNGCNSLTNLNLSSFDTNKIINMGHMFYDCSSLTSLDLSSFDTKNVTYMGAMFYNCSSLTSLDLNGFDTRNVTDMSGMFYVCNSLTSLDLNNFDTSNVTDMRWMFSECSSLTNLDLSNFDTRNVTDMSRMFSGCSSLASLDLNNFDTRNVSNMQMMFDGCSSLTNLDLSNFDTSNVTNISYMFSRCNSLTSLDLSDFDTSNVIHMGFMFDRCSSLTSLNLSNIDTRNVNYMSGMFSDCSSLTSLDLSGFNTSNVTDMVHMFSNCNSLTEVKLGPKFTKWIDDAYLLAGKWTNGELVKSETELYSQYPDNASQWAGTWRKAVDVTSISLDRETLELKKGESESLTATVSPDNATIKEVEWTSSNEAVATVDENGTVTAVGAGTATITATTTDGTQLSDTCEVTVTEEREAVRMMTTNLLLEGNIGIQYKTRVPDAENTKVVIHYENGAYEDISYLASEGKHIEGTDEYWYKVPVTSIEMGDTVSIWFTDLEGNKVPFVANSTGADLSEKGAEYSVRKYIERKLNDPDETLRALVRAIKDYGDYAQLYFDYKVDEVEAGEIGDISQGELIGYKKGREGTDPSGITVKESNLLLGSETTIQYKMILEDDSTIGEYEFRMNGEEAKAEKVGSYWIVRKENVSADLLDEMYEFEVRRAGEANVSKYRYGAFSYIYSKLGGNDEGLKELCKAIYWYSKATESYMENH